MVLFKLEVEELDTSTQIDLHSTMVLFKFQSSQKRTSRISYLHSTMVLFKSWAHWRSRLYAIIYIPLWSYSNVATFNDDILNYLIYIPLWSYSNRVNRRHYRADIQFTFHYGPIQIGNFAGYSAISQVFTFHYGPIQIKFEFMNSSYNYAFTFHYGPIQINYVNSNKADTTKFTFHYGPIQMGGGARPSLCIAHLHSTMVLFKLSDKHNESEE